MGAHCSIICCPNCGYQIPDEQQSYIANALVAVWGRVKRLREREPQVGPDQPFTLCQLPIGQRAEVVEIRTDERNRLATLSAYGVVPGSYVMLRRRAPAYVLVVDETEVALDTHVADQIVVRVEAVEKDVAPQAH
jgi:Fe2+ transport system protein FeoA